MKLLIFLLASSLAFAGQSVVLTGGVVGNTSIPAQTANSDCRVEMSIHDWVTAGAGHLADLSACGFDVTLYYNAGNSFFGWGDNRAVGGGSCQISAIGLPSTFITFRFQRITASKINTCEAWDINGVYLGVGGSGYSSNQASYTSISGSNSNGVCVSGTDGFSCIGGYNTMSTAYLRLYTTTVPVGSTPPTTAQDLTGCLVSWKFDLGNNTPSLNDSCSAGPYNATVLGGSDAFTATPGQTLVKAIATSGAYDAGCKCGIPSWDVGWVYSESKWVSARINHTNSLDGSRSYSQADASPSVTYVWTVTGGPMTPSLTGGTTAGPTYTPTLFGSYSFHLVATDAAANTGTDDLTLGAVDYDDNFQVIPSDPNVTKIFGPITAFGYNPWGYEDERHWTMVGLQNSYYINSWGLNNPSWATFGTGTVAYAFNGKGLRYGATGTTITAGINATDTSIAVADASKIPGITSLPTWIVINTTYSDGWQGELIRICSTTATTGAATLTVCYDGRGLSGWSDGQGGHKFLAAQSWSSGAAVGEDRVSGTSTLFVTDTNTAICPAGAPGPPGPVVYSTGTVTGSGTTITGSGTTWNSGTGVVAGTTIRISATHSGGTPFVWWSIIASVTDTTHLVTDRALPADVDGSSFSYKIVTFRNVSLQFTAADASGATGTWQGLQHTVGCESETAMFITPSRDNSLDAQSWTGVKYTYDDAIGIQSQYGPNFYGSGFANRAFYFRSGWDFAKTTADLMDENWVTNPELAGGWYGGFVLLQGGGVIGAIADLVLNPSTALHWSDVRPFLSTGAGVTSLGCNDGDSRDTGYMEAWVALGALFDPDSTANALWTSTMATILTREQTCKGTDNSWPSGTLFNPSIGPLTLTNGSTTVTGTGLPSGMCYGIASGNVTVTNGSASFTGTGLVDGAAINILGTTGGGATQLPVRANFTQSGSTSGSLGVLWPGDSGTFSYVIENNGNMTAIGANVDDPALSENWACTWVSSTQITLNRPWDLANSSGTKYLFQNSATGIGQQAYMLGGMKTQALQWGSLLAGATGTGFAALKPLSANWLQTTGYNPQSKGLYYANGYQACTPAITQVVPGAGRPTCDSGAEEASRALTPEAVVSLGVNYIGQSYAPSAKSWGDEAYGAIWGYCPWTAAGYYCDSGYVNQENSNGGLASYKWPGFFFGMGVNHQWPVMRLLGPTASSDSQSTSFRGTKINGVIIH